MSFFSRLKSAVKKFFGGGSSDRGTTRRASRVSNYGGGGSRSYRDYSGGGYASDYESRQQREARERKERKDKQDKTTSALASISKRTDSLASGKSSSPAASATSVGSGTTRVLAKIGEKSKATPPDPKEQARKRVQKDATQKLQKISDDRKEFNKATGNKYNVDKNGTKARIAQKSQAYDVKAEKYETEKHPVATSLGRGAVSGLTFGGSEVLAKTSKNRRESGAEAHYQKNKSAKAEMAGEIAGSLVGFGLTEAGATKLASKVAPKALKSGGANVAKQLAKNSAFRTAAKKEAERTGIKVTEEVIDRFAAQRAQRLVNSIGADMAVNLTTGGAMDVNQSLRESMDENGNIDWKKFRSEMGTNAALNLGLGGAVTVAPALRTSKGIIRRGAREDALNLARRMTDEGRVKSMMDTFSGNAERAGRNAQALAERGVKETTDALSPMNLSSKADKMSEMRKAMQDTFARDADESRRVDMNEALAQNSPFRQTDEAVQQASADASRAVDTSSEAIQNEALNAVRQTNNVPDTAVRGTEVQAPRKPAEILQGYKSTGSRKKISAAQKRVDELIAQGDTRSAREEINRTVDEVLRDTRIAGQLDDTSQEIKDYIKGTRISVPDKVDAGYKAGGYNELRKGNFGSLKLTDDGTPVDQLWLELQDRFGPSLFPDEITDTTAQLDYLADLARRKGDDLELPDDELAHLREQLSDSMWESANRGREHGPFNMSDEEWQTMQAAGRPIEPEELAELEGRNLRETELEGEIPEELREAPMNNIEQTARQTEPPEVRQTAENAAEAEARQGAETATEEEIRRAEQTQAGRAEIREEHESLNAQIQKASDGKYGARKSYVTASDFANDAEVDRLVKENRKAMDQLSNGDGLGDILKSDRAYVRSTREDRDRIAREEFVKAINDPDGTIEKLRDKLKMGDQFTIEDFAQMTAIKNYCNAQGIKLPADVAEDFSKVYMHSQTERAQLLRSSYLFMAENDPDFKKQILRKDLNRFRERICNVNEKEWGRMRETLEKSHAEDWKKVLNSLSEAEKKDLENRGIDNWLDYEIDRLSKMTGADNKEAFEKGYRDLCKDVYRHTEPSFWEVVSLIRHSFMLSNLKTGLNNILGNASQLQMYRMSDMLHIAFENRLEASAKRQGKEFTRTTAMLKDKSLRKLAQWSSLQSGALGESISKNAKETEFEKLFNAEVKKRVSDAMGDSKYGFDFEKGASIRYDGMGKVKGATIKGAQKASKAVGFMLNEPDSWFVEKSYRLAFAKYLQANGITTAEQFAKNEKLIREASDHAFDVALENTYKKANRLVSFLEGARSKGYAKGSKLYQKAIAVGLDAELPYLKVPANLVINNFKYSPMGLIKTGIDAHSALRAGDIDALNKACTNLSKNLTGTGMAAIGFFLACDDQADENDWGFISSARDELKEYGVRDNSFKIGNKNLSIANMGIGTVQFLMGTRYAEEINARGGAPSSFLDNFDVLTSVFAANFDSIADMSLLDNAFAIFDAVSNKGDYEMKRSEALGNLAYQIAGNYTGQFVPSPMRAIARGTTSSDLDTGIKKDGNKYTQQMRRSANNIVSGIPGLNEKVLPHKVDRHGNYVNERKTAGDKAKASLQNVLDPFNTKTVRIPEADKIELSVTKDTGKPYQPKAFDENRKYQAKIGQGQHAEKIDLTGKEREQAARAYKTSGYDMAHNLVYSSKGWFGDSHGERAQQLLNSIPDDEEKAREYLYNTPEFKKLSNDEKVDFMNALYDMRLGRGRSANYEVYVNMKQGDEGDFRFQNDLAWQQQDKYSEYGLDKAGITKGQWADIIEAAKWESHKYTDEGKNRDTINSAWKLKNALMNIEGLTPEQRVAAYQAFRGKRNGFGWYDWDGATLKGYRRYGRRRYRRWRRRGHGGSGSGKVPTPKTIKASSLKKGEALVSKRSSSSTKVAAPKLERVKAKIDLPEAKW